MPRDTYRFQPMTADDLPLVRRWLMTAHVSEWWGDPPEQLTLVTEDLDEPAMDQYIGEADMVGCGHGYAFIRAFTDHLLATGTPRVITDPDPANARAIRAY